MFSASATQSTASNTHAGLSEAASGSTDVSSAITTISTKLNQEGLFNDVTHSELRDISTVLSSLNPAQKNQVIAQLSDQQLATLASEIDSNGILGTGGLSKDERVDLFNDVAPALDAKQLNRVYSAFGNSETNIELMDAAAAGTSADKVIAMAEAAITSGFSTIDIPRATTELQTVRTLRDASNMAEFSADVYNDFQAGAALVGGARRLNPEALPKELGIDASQLIDNTSGYHAAIYQRGVGDDATYVVSFRGTNFSEMNDWKTNLGSAFGETTQFRRAKELVGALVLAKGADHVQVTGHSLGGGLANYAAISNGVQATSFNPKGSTISERWSVEDFSEKADQLVHNYAVEGEVLTGFQNALTINPVLSRLQRPAPGELTTIPAIKPDGAEGRMVLEAATEVALKVSPFHSADEHNISGPIDRHGMNDYVIRGMAKASDNAESALLQTLAGAH